MGIFPPDIGGPATYVPRMADALASRGHEVTVVAPQEKSVSCPIINPSYRLGRFYRAHFLRYVNYFIELCRAFITILCEAKKCDILFVNGLDVAALLASKLTGKPMIVKIVGDQAWELAHTRGWTKLNLEEFQKVHGLRISFFKVLYHLTAKRAQAVITPSQYLAHIVEGWGISTNRIQVVYNAFAVPDQLVTQAGSKRISRENLLLETNIPPSFYQGFRLLTVGRLVPHKRISSIIEVLARMNEVRLVIVGDGPERQNLKVLTKKLGLTNQVLLTGQLSQEKVWGLMTQYAQALILNSTYEGLPHILLEAAYFGVPVVATAVGGTPEIVQDGKAGLLIPPDSPEDLLAALRRLQTDVALRQRLAVNACCATARFSFEQMINKTEQVLKTSV